MLREVEHPLRREDRTRLVAPGERSPDRQRALGKEEPLGRLARGAHRRVAKVQERRAKVALLNAFGFGSNNAALVFKKWQ